MTHVVFAGIDGTGPEWFWDDPKYDQDFADSHVNFLNKNWVSNDVYYSRGTTIIDTTSDVDVKNAYNDVMRQLKKYGNDSPVFLAGYSRGGGAVIDVARMLKKYAGVSVFGLILFDPVARSPVISGRTIVDTVKNVIYAQRDPVTKSRESFGNCGKFLEDKTKTKMFPRKIVFGTHGGVGGCPHVIPEDNPKGLTERNFIVETFPDLGTFVTYKQDQIASREVRGWMQNLVHNLIFEAIECGKPIEIPEKQIPGNGQRIHVVKAGDWLSKLAITYYGDMNKWEVIYKYPPNLEKIGPNPDLIKVGDELVIP